MEIHQPFIGMPLRGEFPDLLVAWPFIQLEQSLEVIVGPNIITRKDGYSSEAAQKDIFRGPPSKTPQRGNELHDLLVCHFFKTGQVQLPIYDIGCELLDRSNFLGTKSQLSQMIIRDICQVFWPWESAECHSVLGESQAKVFR